MNVFKETNPQVCALSFVNDRPRSCGGPLCARSCCLRLELRRLRPIQRWRRKIPCVKARPFCPGIARCATPPAVPELAHIGKRRRFARSRNAIQWTTFRRPWVRALVRDTRTCRTLYSRRVRSAQSSRTLSPFRRIEPLFANYAGASCPWPWPTRGMDGMKMRASVGMISRLQIGESSMPPTITHASGCCT